MVERFFGVDGEMSSNTIADGRRLIQIGRRRGHCARRRQAGRGGALHVAGRLAGARPPVGQPCGLHPSHPPRRCPVRAKSR